ncbi:hypothetical protein SDC9_143970 [bioreactor metagenome]|uniref:DUF4364 domain-containing protein n=1 Tax=bioreactor metagenome TaxID=1076179 RepID=A0A645E5M3_9ZZZZ
MSYFSEGVTKNKLTVLYFMQKLGLAITKDQITTVGAAYDLAPYFELQSAVAEMEEDGLLAAVPRPFGQVYALSARGQEVVEMFKERLPVSLRDDLDSYADECRDDIRRQTQYSAKIERRPGGECLVRCLFMEKEEPLLSIELLFPDAASANKAAAIWEKKAEDAYCYLLSSLSDSQ